MQFYSMTFMPWPHLPEDYGGSAWVVCPNDNYDPVLGTDTYRGYLDLLVQADELGFDGIALNEHHQTPYCGMPSPNLIAAIVARTTQRARILVLGNALPLYNPPLRVAEEYAMIDVISGGRLEAGMVVGDMPGYYSYGINPTEARARFNEALELIRQAWTRPGPFEFSGEYYRYQHVNPWPRPVQTPHPPIWVPGLGSPDTMKLCAENDFHYVTLPFFHRDFVEKNYASFRRTWLDAGRAPDPSRLGLLFPIYVAETDAEARAQFEQHYWYFTRRLLPGIQVNTPGYTAEAALLRMMTQMDSFMTSVTDWEDVIAGGYVLAGSPETVTERLCERIETSGAGNFLGVFQLGSMPYGLAARNHELFATDVMPKVRKEFPNGPVWAEATTASGGVR
ncbi:MAG TPA: LLM class flavin-dependent oxidoreductase [Pseudonocardia sp.]|nr:LLM class flavin-dependent oxidoreductase [Pseudonocardia sp.]